MLTNTDINRKQNIMRINPSSIQSWYKSTLMEAKPVKTNSDRNQSHYNSIQFNPDPDPENQILVLHYHTFIISEL